MNKVKLSRLAELTPTPKILVWGLIPTYNLRRPKTL